MARAHNFIDRTGEEYLTNEGYWITIIEYFNAHNCTIKFEGGLLLKEIKFGEIKSGKIKNPLHRSVCGVGYLGVGVYSQTINGKRTKSYSKWICMIERCYSPKELKKRPTYKDVTVCDEWHNFQKFAAWFEQKYNSEFMESWQLDKDFLSESTKIYSPETCCIIPCEINNLLTQKITSNSGVARKGLKYSSYIKLKSFQLHLGMYSTKEEAFNIFIKNKYIHIKEMADKWRPFIDPRVYGIICNYKIKINE